MTYIQPIVYRSNFTCPHCGAISEQRWWNIAFNQSEYSASDKNQIRVGTCTHCRESTLWYFDTMVFPDTGIAPIPNTEMPDAVKKLYLEAAGIHLKSSRGAGALLRLAIQVLCKELGGAGKNINDDIAALVRKGLPEIVQKSLDAVRVIGNGKCQRSCRLEGGTTNETGKRKEALDS